MTQIRLSLLLFLLNSNCSLCLNSFLINSNILNPTKFPLSWLAEMKNISQIKTIIQTQKRTSKSA